MNRVRIGHLTTSYHTAFILMGTGWIEKKIGVKPEWNMFPTGPEMIKAFAKNELDVGYIGLPPTMIGIDQGVPIKCIAGGHMEGTILITKGNLKTYEETGNMKETLEQLKGKTVGTPSRGSIHDVIMRTLLDGAGLQQVVSIRNFDWADQVLYAMENNEVQAAAGTPPLAVLASQLLGAKIMLPPQMMWPHNPSYGIVTTLEMIESCTEMLKRFLTLHEEACNIIRKEPCRAAKIVSDVVRIMDAEFILQVYKVSPKYCASLSPEYIKSAMAFVPVLQRMRYIKRAITEQDMFHKAIIESVHDQPPHYDDPFIFA
jgi:NitT/TauT family transport system substrate-binding protein